MSSKLLMTVMLGGLSVLVAALVVLIVLSGRKPVRHHGVEQGAGADASDTMGAAGTASPQDVETSSAAPGSAKPARGVPSRTVDAPRAQRPADPGLIEMREIDGPVEGVRVLAFSPDGTKLAAGGEDKLVHVYDVAGGSELLKMAHAGAISDVRFSPDGSKMVSTGEDGLRIWDAATGKPVEAIDPMGRAVEGRFAGNDRVVAAVGEKMMIWKVGAGAEPERVIETGSEISCMDASPDGADIVTGQSKAGMIRVWNVADGKLAKAHTQGMPGMNPIHLGDQDRERYEVVQKTEFLDSERVLVCAADAGTYILQWKTESYVDLGLNDRPGSPEVWAGNGNFVVRDLTGGAALTFADSAAERVKFEHLTMDSREASIKIGSVGCSCLALGKDLMAVGSSLHLEARKAEHPEDVAKVRLVKVSVMNEALAKWHDSLAQMAEKQLQEKLASPRGRLDYESNKAIEESSIPVKVIEASKSAFAQVHFSPDGKLLAAAGGDHVVHLFNTETWEEVRKLEGHTDAVSDICFSKDGKKLLSSGWDASVIEWDVASGRIEKRVKSNTHVLRCALLPDGKHAVTTGLFVQFWDMEHEKQTGTGRTEEEVHALFVSPGGTIATMDNSEHLSVWDPGTAKTIRVEAFSHLNMRGYFFDDKTLRFFDGGTAIEMNVETGEKKKDTFEGTAMTTDGKLALREDGEITGIRGGRRLVAYVIDHPREGEGVPDPQGRYVVYAVDGDFDAQGFESMGPGRILVYDLKKLEAADEVYEKLAAYDTEHNLDDEGKPLR